MLCAFNNLRLNKYLNWTECKKSFLLLTLIFCHVLRTTRTTTRTRWPAPPSSSTSKRVTRSSSTLTPAPGSLTSPWTTTPTGSDSCLSLQMKKFLDSKRQLRNVWEMENMLTDFKTDKIGQYRGQMEIKSGQTYPLPLRFFPKM